MRVRIYPGGAVANIGDERWVTEWHSAIPAAERKREADEDYEFDYDRDLVTHYRSFKTRDEALTEAKKQFGDSFFGVATVTKQVVEMLDGPHGVGEWNDCGTPEEVSE